MKPLFKHDCTKCKFIGNVYVEESNKRIEADLWKSCVIGTDSFILRYSEEGSDYNCFSKEYLYRYLY
jgi:hypothetical protein